MGNVCDKTEDDRKARETLVKGTEQPDADKAAPVAGTPAP